MEGRFTFKKLSEAYRVWAIHPLFAGAGAIVGAIAGVLGAVWTDQVRSAFPFDCCTGAIEWKAVIFWIFVIAFGGIFGSNFWAQSATLDEHTDRLQGGLDGLRSSSSTIEKTLAEHADKLQAAIGVVRESSATLGEQIRSLPPQNFLEGFEALLLGCYPVAVKASLPSATVSEVKEGIISVLSSLAYMAQLFDAGPKATEYSANIMVFRDFATLDSEAIAALERRAKFSFRAGSGGGSWSGVLELIPSLAVFLRDGRIYLEGTARLPRFVLEVPLPQYRSDYGRSLVVPGAPEAFCEGGWTFVHDTHELAEQCRKHRGLREKVVSEMDRYFRAEEGQDIRSFVSIALPRFVDGHLGADRTKTPVGVINIHCGVTNMLRSRGASLFVPMTAPHKLLISRLVENFLRIEPGMSI
jgi:hypothetical protein